jgi:hypothetical protein
MIFGKPEHLYRSSAKRVFLTGADPFVLKRQQAEDAIAQKVNEVFPEVETIAMYASIKEYRREDGRGAERIARTENQ